MSTSLDLEIHNTRPRRTPLPKVQLSVLLYMQLAEPLTSTVIYPFVNQLVRDTGITKGDEKKTGYYAGLIESLFYAVEAVCVLQWGRVSDRIGRKPVLLGGLSGLTVSMIGFGLSKKFWALILSRCAQGALNGNVGVTKAYMAEISDPSNMAEAFAFLPLVWTTGSTLGPIIGGVLANPAVWWPKTPSLLRTYPYFLPCVTTAAISVSAALLVFFFLKETLPNAIRRNNERRTACFTPDHNLPPDSSTSGLKEILSTAAGNVATAEPFNVSPSEHQPETYVLHTGTESDRLTAVMESHSAPPSLRSLLIRRVVLPILNYAFLAFIDQCFLVLQPLMYSTSISDGGLGFSSLTIGAIMGVWGVVSGVIQILAFAKIMRSIGARRLYMIGFSCYLVCIGMFPLESHLAQRAGRVDEKVWGVIVVQLSFYILAYMSYGCIFIYVSDGAPSRAALGATNGLAQCTASTMRALAPSAASSLFAESLEHNLVRGTMVYWILWIIIAAGMYASSYLPRRLLSQEG